MQKLILYSIVSLLTLIIACDPEDNIEPIVADFTIEYIDGNTVKLVNTAPSVSRINWDLGDFGEENGVLEIEVFFPDKGEYPVTMSIIGQGGVDEITKFIVIEQNINDICQGTLEYITGCGTKTWKLNPAAGALWVGSSDGSTTFWENSEADLLDRPCDWNDEYVFTFAGPYEYISNGDLWGEGYTGFSNDDCYSINDLPADLSAWADGTHSFQVISGSPEKLRVTGEGAFIGLRKAANGSEVNTPQLEVIYDIIDMRTENGKEILELEIDYGGGIWRFTLYSW